MTDINNKNKIIEFLIKNQVLSFGSYETNSGRVSPYFFNFSAINNARTIQTLAGFYTDLIIKTFGNSCRHVFGPSYKGIPLAIANSQEITKRISQDVFFTFDRKESKDHGEGGNLVGYKYTGNEKVLIVEDVLTSGKSIEKSLLFLEHYKVRVMGVVVAIDRQEKGSSQKSAKAQLVEKYNIPIFSLLSLEDIFNYLKKNQEQFKTQIPKIKDYMSYFCATL